MQFRRALQYLMWGKYIREGCLRWTMDNRPYSVMHPLCRVLMSVFIFFSRMWGNSIGDQGAEAFAEALRNHPRLTNLRYEREKETETDTVIITKIEDGKIDSNELSPMVLLFLWSSLSANGITSEGGKCLAEALKENSVLRIFWYEN